MIRKYLSFKEKTEVISINVVYEPNYEETVPVKCCFTNEIHLAY